MIHSFIHSLVTSETDATRVGLDAEGRPVDRETVVVDVVDVVDVVVDVVDVVDVVVDDCR